MVHLLHYFWGKILTGSGQVAELWRYKRYSLRPIFQGTHVFSHVRTLLPLTGMDILCMIRPGNDHIWPLALYLDLWNVFRGQWPWLTPYIVPNLTVLGVSWGPETEYVAIFSHRHVYSASLHYLMSISAIDSVCPQAILATSVTLFPFEMLCVTNIPSINCNYTLFCSELNGEHAGESFRSLRFILFEIYVCKVEKWSISRKFDLWPLITTSNIHLGSKNAPPITSTHREQSADFFR